MELHRTDTVLLAALTREELSAYRLSFGALRAGDPSTARLLREILRRAKTALRFSPPKPGKLRVDALPEKDGGCIFLFTARKGRLRVLAAPPLLLWQTADANAFLDLFCLLRRAPAMCAGLSALYRTEGGFAGLFSFADAKAAKKGARLLAEYGDVRAAGREMRRHLDEHARALMPPKAPTPAAPRPRAL